jgi:hypothetical protein
MFADFGHDDRRCGNMAISIAEHADQVLIGA